jgi:thymidylate kinase
VIQTRKPRVIRENATHTSDTLPALAAILEQLAEAHVRYCSWKSNEHLSDGLAGRTDLDLLVEHADAPRFRSIVDRNGLKRLSPGSWAAYPGMEHHLGLDRSSGRLFHLHVHYQLVLGEQHVKNHRIPLEREFLDSARRLDGVPVPSPELELSILAVRALLKYRARDVVKDVFHIRSPGLRRPIRDEIRWLLTQTTPESVEAALRATGRVVPPDVVRAFLETIARDPRAGAALLRLRSRIREELSEFQRQGRVRASAHALAVMWRRRRSLESRMIPQVGGTTIALIGPDGSGKSTIAADLVRWLGWKLAVRSYYMGSKSPSVASRASYLAFRAARRGHRAASVRLGAGSPIAGMIRKARDGLLALHYVAVGRDRSRRYEEGRREAAAGRIVIFDRFPLTRLSHEQEHHLLDGPRIRSVLPSAGGFTWWLATLEERIYRRMRLPDHLVFLLASADVSARRKPDHRFEALTAKATAAEELATLADSSSEPVDVIRIDADLPLEVVLLEVKSRLWDVL